MVDHEDPEDQDEQGDGEEESATTVLPPPKPPDKVELSRWWRAYCEMQPPRAYTKLAAAVQAQTRRVRKAVHEGWPELGIPAFRDREMAPEPLVAEVVGRATSEAIERVAIVVAGSWAEDARGHLRSLPRIGAAIEKLSEVLVAQVESASLVKYRSVPDLDDNGIQRRGDNGEALTVLKPYVSASDAALAAQRLMAARKDHAVLNKALLDSLAPFRSSEMDFSDAPPEVMEYLKKKFVGRAA